MVTACYVVWNEASHIAESIRSVKAYVDRFVVVDGAFSTNPIGRGPSTDGTRAEVERACGTTSLKYIIPSISLLEHEARNWALSEVDAGDWVLVLDGDEIFYGDFAKVRDSAVDVALSIYTTAVLFEGNADMMDEEAYQTNPVISTAGQQPRFFRKTSGTLYQVKMVDVGGRRMSFVHLYRGLQEITGSLVEGAFIINRHVSQSFAGYQADYAWESAQLVSAQ